MAQQFGCGIAVEDYREVLADPEVEAVSVCTPNKDHSEIAIAAMKACMKPEGTPYFEGICDLNGDPVEEAPAAEAAGEEPAAEEE